MIIKKISEGMYLMSMNIDDMLFESMWDLPHGVTMNSYIVKGEKTAIIDGVIGWDGVPETLYKQLDEIKINPNEIDYVIVNHMEPDHSGWLNDFKKVNDSFTVVTTKKGAAFVKAYYGDNFDILVVNEADTIDLGNDFTLRFHPIPNVHWPETMMTYETTTQTLFPCDLYGAFGTMNDHYFDDEMTTEEQTMFDREGVRYFSNVLTTFSPMVKRAISKTKELDPNVIAPGHGPIYRTTPNTIISQYERLCQYANGFGTNKITIVWGSMYGVTKNVVREVEKYLEEINIPYKSIHLPYDTVSNMITNVFESAGVIIAASTYEYRMFTPVAHAIDELGRKKVTNKHALYFGSYGWNPSADNDLMKIIDQYKMKWNFVEPTSFEGSAKSDKIKQIKTNIDTLIESMQKNII